jgi:UDP-N-acetyl-D-mannosaminuronic acid dehydrogenase
LKKKLTLVIVGGCGHVGLPLGLAFADRNVGDVYLLDVDQAKVDLVNSKRAPFMEEGIEPLIERVVGKSVFATSDNACLGKADVVITVIGTPVDKHLNPMVNDLKKNIDSILQYMRDDTLLVLRSTVYPGVTSVVDRRIREMGRNIHLAFCPERILEGKALQELVELPQIVAAFEPGALLRARQLFEQLTSKILEMQPLEAELAKLFTNSWRYLNFSISNQFYMLAESYGLDFQRIYNAVTTDYPRMKNFARPGFAAGPCLLKDTVQLAAFAKNTFFLGHAAMLINEGLPNFLVEQLRSSVNLTGLKVGILGMAFKANSDDARDSLSYKLKNLLEVHCQEVLCTDEYIKNDPSLVSLDHVLREANIVILAAPHRAYLELKLPKSTQVVDCWGYLKAQQDTPVTTLGFVTATPGVPV